MSANPTTIFNLKDKTLIGSHGEIIEAKLDGRGCWYVTIDDAREDTVDVWTTCRLLNDRQAEVYTGKTGLQHP